MAWYLLQLVRRRLESRLALAAGTLDLKLFVATVGETSVVVVIHVLDLALKY